MHLPIAMGPPSVFRFFQHLSSCAPGWLLKGPKAFDDTTLQSKPPSKPDLPAELWLVSSRPLPRNHSIVHVIILVSVEGVLPSPGHGLKDGLTGPVLPHTSRIPLQRHNHLTSLLVVNIGELRRYWTFKPPMLIQDVMLFTSKLS